MRSSTRSPISVEPMDADGPSVNEEEDDDRGRARGQGRQSTASRSTSRSITSDILMQSKHPDARKESWERFHGLREELYEFEEFEEFEGSEESENCEAATHVLDAIAYTISCQQKQEQVRITKRFKPPSLH